MEELKKEIIEAVQDSIDLTDNQVSIPTLNIMLDEILPEQLRLYVVMQQRELLKAFAEQLRPSLEIDIGFDYITDEDIEECLEAFNGA